MPALTAFSRSRSGAPCRPMMCGGVDQPVGVAAVDVRDDASRAYESSGLRQSHHLARDRMLDDYLLALVGACIGQGAVGDFDKACFACVRRTRRPPPPRKSGRERHRRALDARRHRGLQQRIGNDHTRRPSMAGENDAHRKADQLEAFVRLRVKLERAQSVTGLEET